MRGLRLIIFAFAYALFAGYSVTSILANVGFLMSICLVWTWLVHSSLCSLRFQNSVSILNQEQGFQRFFSHKQESIQSSHSQEDQFLLIFCLYIYTIMRNAEKCREMHTRGSC